MHISGLILTDQKNHYFCRMARFKILSLCLLMTLLVRTMQAKDSITVYIFLLDECRICQEIAPELNALYTTYKSPDLNFIGVFPNFASKPQGIKDFKSKYKIAFDTKTDYFKKITHKFQATILPEVIVYNETKQKIIYRGQVNDLYYAPSKRRPLIRHHYLRDAIMAGIDNRMPTIQETNPIGCFINFNDSFSQN